MPTGAESQAPVVRQPWSERFVGRIGNPSGRFAKPSYLSMENWRNDGLAIRPDGLPNRPTCQWKIGETTDWQSVRTVCQTVLPVNGKLAKRQDSSVCCEDCW